MSQWISEWIIWWSNFSRWQYLSPHPSNGSDSGPMFRVLWALGWPSDRAVSHPTPWGLPWNPDGRNRNTKLWQLEQIGIQLTTVFQDAVEWSLHSTKATNISDSIFIDFWAASDPAVNGCRLYLGGLTRSNQLRLVEYIENYMDGKLRIIERTLVALESVVSRFRLDFFTNGSLLDMSWLETRA